METIYTLATLSTFGTLGKHSSDLHFYILDNNGSIVNEAIFKNIRGAGGAGCLTTVFKDRIFLVTDGLRDQKDKDTEIAKLICFKINPCKMK